MRCKLFSAACWASVTDWQPEKKVHACSTSSRTSSFKSWSALVSELAKICRRNTSSLTRSPVSTSGAKQAANKQKERNNAENKYSFFI